MPQTNHARPAPTQPSPMMVQWFAWYSRRFIAKNFHAMRLSNLGLPPADDDLPLVVYANHASWWDPLVGIVLKHAFYRTRDLYAPIDARALQQYGILRKLGFFPIRRNTTLASRDFLRACLDCLHSPRSLVMLTPQGKFADPRVRPIQFEPGVGHLAARSPGVRFVPVAIEYTFWDQKQPELLVHFGQPLLPSAGQTHAQLTQAMQDSLTQAQDTLAQLAINRNPADFQTLICGRAGQSPAYDLWRKFTALLRGQRFKPEHPL
jgi:1-acyl-sn-glycerol-3-phosphate acyltransferase